MTSATRSVSDNIQIEMTEDYSIFKSIVGNRDVVEKHVLYLMEEMKKNDLFTPIIVNENMEIIDGQHRLEARRRLEYIVPYYISEGLSLKDIQSLNSSQKNWTVQDYAKSYSARGNQNYRIFLDFQERYKLPHTVAVVLLAGLPVHATHINKLFKSGEFKVDAVSESITIANKIEAVSEFFDGYADRSFVVSLIKCLRHPNFDYDRFISKLRSHPRMLIKCANMTQYMACIEDVYNYRVNTANKVSFRYI